MPKIKYSLFNIGSDKNFYSKKNIFHYLKASKIAFLISHPSTNLISLIHN